MSNEPARTLSAQLNSVARQLANMAITELRAAPASPSHARPFVDLARELMALRRELNAADFEEPPGSINLVHLDEEGIA